MAKYQPSEGEFEVVIRNTRGSQFVVVACSKLKCRDTSGLPARASWHVLPPNKSGLYDKDFADIGRFMRDHLNESPQHLDEY